jgi:hypothetical protein
MIVKNLSRVSTIAVCMAGLFAPLNVSAWSSVFQISPLLGNPSAPGDPRSSSASLADDDALRQNFHRNNDAGICVKLGYGEQMWITPIPIESRLGASGGNQAQTWSLWVQGKWFSQGDSLHSGFSLHPNGNYYSAPASKRPPTGDFNTQLYDVIVPPDGSLYLWSFMEARIQPDSSGISCLYGITAGR